MYQSIFRHYNETPEAGWFYKEKKSIWFTVLKVQGHGADVIFILNRRAFPLRLKVPGEVSVNSAESLKM